MRGFEHVLRQAVRILQDPANRRALAGPPLAEIRHIELPQGFRWAVTPGGVTACHDPQGGIYSTLEGCYVDDAERIARVAYRHHKEGKFRTAADA